MTAPNEEADIDNERAAVDNDDLGQAQALMETFPAHPPTTTDR